MQEKRIYLKTASSDTSLTNTLFQGIKFFSAKDIHKLISMKEVIRLMELAFSSYSSHKSNVPERHISGFPGLPMDVFFKPVYSSEMGRIAVKILTQKTGDSVSGSPTILGIVILVDANTGEILSLSDGACLTALRTGAASGIATQYLAREDAQTVAIFGCGTQGHTQLEAVCRVRPIERALLYDINPEACERLRSNMQGKLDIPISIEKDLQNLKKADVICTVTNSESPLFRRKDISEGVHINAIGSYKPNMQEIDPEIVSMSNLYVDCRKAVIKESGDLIRPIIDGVISSDFVRAEIGDLINNDTPGRKSGDEITVFKSVGLAVQDLFVANAIYEKSQKDQSPETKFV